MIQKYIFLISLFVTAVFLSTCKKEVEKPSGSNKVVLTTTTATEISYSSVKLSSDISNVSSSTVISQHGYCINIEPHPAIANNHTSLGNLTTAKSFNCNIGNLQPGTLYFARPYASFNLITIYGSEISFTTTALSIPTLTTSAATNTTQVSVTSGGNITSDGGSAVTARGVCWSKSSNPTMADAYTINDTGTGTFTGSLTGLEANTLYHIRAYATNSIGSSYGNDVTFTTLANPVIPVVTTTIASNITQTTATSGGNVTSDGGATVTARGVCWSTSSNPTISSSHTSDGNGTGVFSSSLNSLSPSTTYYIRAYATNNIGTSYGNQVSVVTLANLVIANVTTTAASNIGQTTAISGGNITSDGGTSVTARGLCWSTSSNPTISNSHTSDGSGTGVFSSSLTGLNPSTTYHIRAYATNNAGTAYGSDLSFTTSFTPVLPTVITTAASNITKTTASSGGNITSDGGASITARGVCWSTSQNPTTSYSHTSDGTGTGLYTSNITGVYPNNYYYLRSYAINSVGTAYGDQLVFLTPSVKNKAIVQRLTVANSPISTNNWHYIAVTKSANLTGKIYIDGQLVSDTLWGNNTYIFNSMYIGASYHTNFGSFYKGWLDELRISSVIRSQSEIQTNYNSNAPFSGDEVTIGLWHFNETSGNTFSNQIGGQGTLTGSPSFVTGLYGNCIYFDGINDVGSCNIDPPENNITIECWIKFDATANSSAIIQLYGANNSYIGLQKE